LISAGASAPDPAEGVYSAPRDPLAGFKGPTSKGRGLGREGKGEREGNAGGEEEVEGGEGREGREGTPCVSLNFP